MKKILIIDDEFAIIQTIRTYFENYDYVVLEAACAEGALELLAEEPDIILLDIMMPGMDGISFCQQIRGQIHCPILFLSARVDEFSKVSGFSAGGDDYVTKPFSMRELQARIEAHLRREERPRSIQDRMRFGELWIDYCGKEIGIKDAVISFSKKEYLIIEFLSQYAGQTFSHERIYESVWGYDATGDATTSVAEHIKRIRKKLQAYEADQQIETVWGIGYRWKR